MERNIADWKEGVMLPYQIKVFRNRLKGNIRNVLKPFQNEWRNYLDQQTAAALLEYDEWFDNMDKPGKGFLQQPTQYSTQREKQLSYARGGINRLKALIDSVNKLYETKLYAHLDNRLKTLQGQSNVSQEEINKVEDFLKKVNDFLLNLSKVTPWDYFETLAQYVDGNGRPQSKYSPGEFMKKVAALANTEVATRMKRLQHGTGKNKHPRYRSDIRLDIRDRLRQLYKKIGKSRRSRKKFQSHKKVRRTSTTKKHTKTRKSHKSSKKRGAKHSKRNKRKNSFRKKSRKRETSRTRRQKK